MTKPASRTATLEAAITAALAAGDEEAAAAMLRRAFGGDATSDCADLPELLEELADYFLSQDRPEDAMAAASRAVLLTSSRADAPDALRRRCRIAEILLDAGLPEEACAVYAAITQEAAGETWVHEAAGTDYLDAGEHELAFAWLTAGLELAVADGEPEAVDRLHGLRRRSMRALGRPLDDLDRRATELVPTPDGHSPEADDILLLEELDRCRVPTEQVLRVLRCLRGSDRGSHPRD